MEAEKVAKFIKEIRTKEKLSQQKFAQKYGVTYQAVSKWENAKNMPDIMTLKQICNDYHTNLDDLLEENAERPPLSSKKRPILLTLTIFVFLTFLLLSFFLFRHHKNFEFKTLSPTCDNFNLYGSIAYDNKHSSIYISNITYCGQDNSNQYKKIKCTLYEQYQKTKTQISTYHYQAKTPITLDKFLKQVKFNINNYQKKCKTYTEDNLYLEIEAENNQHITTTYKIPLKPEENCSH